MRVLVTGGAGFVGSHTVDFLLQRGYEVRILDGLMAPVHKGSLPAYVPRQRVQFVQGDIRDPVVWDRALVDVAVVFHMAAYQDYLPDFSTFFHTNSVSTALLYEMIVRKRLPIRKVIVASSQAVYGEGKYLCSQPRSQCSNNGATFPSFRTAAQLARGEWDLRCPGCGTPLEPQWTDESVVSPHTAYALSKYTQEITALNLGQRYDIPTVCMRYSIVQGARQSFRNAYSGVLRIFTQRLLHGKPPVCYEDGRQLRDYVSVHDVVRANVLVLEDDRANFQVFNVGGDRRISVHDYARLIAHRSRVDIEPQVPGVYRFGDTRHVFSDVRKLKMLDWRPEVPLENIIDEYVDWARAQPDFMDYSTDAEQQMEKLGTIRKAV